MGRYGNQIGSPEGKSDLHRLQTRIHNTSAIRIEDFQDGGKRKCIHNYDPDLVSRRAEKTEAVPVCRKTNLATGGVFAIG